MDKAAIDALMNEAAPRGGPGAAIAVQHGGELHSAGYGLANVEWGIPIETDAIFRIGSVTKQFTAAAILRLAEQGKLEIEDPIERHLPDYPVGERVITVRHLLHHTSGIKSYTGLPSFATELMRKDSSLTDLIAVFKDLPPDFQPGEKFLYNNSGYVLLGAIIEALSGKDYEIFLRDEFFAPLGMSRTSYLHDEPIVPKRAAGYAAKPDGAVINAPPLSMSWPHAAGALGSTVHDLLAWNAALHGGKLLSAESYAAMITPGRLNDGSDTGYGYGLGAPIYRERPIIGHNGGINGFLSHLGHWPQEHLTVVVLSNTTAFPIQRVTYALARRALGLPDLAPEAVSASDAELAAGAGVYKFDIGPLQLKAQDGALHANYPLPGSIYRPAGPGAYFLADDPEVTLNFEDLENGVYRTALVQSYGAGAAKGTRVTVPA
jgi:CubicO group peptidase (beta-lactamase class C family)